MYIVQLTLRNTVYTIIMKGTKVLTLSASNLERMTLPLSILTIMLPWGGGL